MAEKDDLTGLLSQFLSAAGDSRSENKENAEESGDNGGIFDNIDAETLIRLMDIFSRLNSTDKNTELLMALKPHLRTENQAKLQRAASLLKIISLLPLLKELGMGDNIF